MNFLCILIYFEFWLFKSKKYGQFGLIKTIEMWTSVLFGFLSENESAKIVTIELILDSD